MKSSARYWIAVLGYFVATNNTLRLTRPDNGFGLVFGWDEVGVIRELISDSQARTRLIQHARTRHGEKSDIQLYEIVIEQFERERR